MNPKLKAEWIAALRSGKFIQGRGRLKHAGRHCCLGVLCEVAGYQPRRHQVDLKLTPLCDAIETGPAAVLMDMNDEQRKSFAQIADHIEKNL